SEHRRRQAAAGASALPYTLVQLAIAPAQRQQLHERIARRFQIMLERGFVEEVEALRLRPGLQPDMPSMRSVGYRQVWEYLDGAVSREEMIAKGVAATRQLAKRQFTWLRGWDELHWLDSLSSDNLPRALKYLAAVSILA